jgi:hypothetical protein
MEVSDQDLRQLVREAISRHTGSPALGALSEARAVARAESNGSFGRFLTLAPTEDGQCIIEPTVRCNHCGYCQSYGH